MAPKVIERSATLSTPVRKRADPEVHEIDHREIPRYPVKEIARASRDNGHKQDNSRPVLLDCAAVEKGQRADEEGEIEQNYLLYRRWPAGA
jgi:hypothetical protein